MAHVEVRPSTFALVLFDAGEIAAHAQRVASLVGFGPDTSIVIDVNEASPLGRATLASLDPITVAAEGGAFEDPRRPRRLSDANTLGSIAKLLFRAHDRLVGGFGDAPPDESLSLARAISWDVYAVGRSERAGLPVQRSRRLYAFRNRHGFSDAADAAFDRLWNADGLTWDGLCAISDPLDVA